ncbi:autotransporter adhesin [[Actinobacillus] rossii]|uniref:Autotransporter adhesin n=1 Tax=[Actinobacillus] rossii TaxID=123820 RepID=A0A380TWB0_9PAST|nr:autotransporter adhesin [[Actinobacillus] rossii]
MIFFSLLGISSTTAFAATGTELNGTNSDNSSIAIGTPAAEGQASTKSGHAIAIGNNATATNINSSDWAQAGSIAIGRNANASAGNSIAIGVASKASAVKAIAMGSDANATANRAIALGADANATAANTTSIGTGANANQTSSTALGADSKAINQDSTAVGYNATASSISTIAIGKDSNAIGSNSTVLGTGASTTTQDSIAIGRGAVMNGLNTGGGIAIGKTSNATGQGALAIGTSAIANATYAHAYGDTTKVHGNHSIAVGLASEISNGSTNATMLGGWSKINGNSMNAVTVGASNKINSSNTVAVGANITIGSDLDGAVVLGQASTTNGSHAISTTTNATVNGLSYSGFKGVASSGGRFVSIGSVGKERKLINVAAGNISASSTEAINGSQLYAVADQLGNVSKVANTANNTANAAKELATTANTTATTANATATRAESIAKIANAEATIAKKATEELNSRKYTFKVVNGKETLSKNDGDAKAWDLSQNDEITFGATKDLNVTTDAQGNIVYGLSSTYSDKINNIEKTANDANTTARAAETQANAANATAAAAKTAAAKATETANTANNTAEAAKNVATEAKETANNAKTIAEDAKTAATEAKDTANSAKTIADGAKTTADQAAITAKGAETLAQAANTTANDAKSIANEADKKADKANETANAADKKADKANETANAADKKADKANETANAADKKADKANETANAANTAVNDLKTRRYTFKIANDQTAGSTDSNAKEWTLNENNNITFGATSDLNVTTDKQGKIIYGLSSSFTDRISKIETSLGTATDGVADDKGLTETDGLNGQSLNDKVNALRNGEAGPIIYTAPDGTRLAKANDGQYYPADKINQDGKPQNGVKPELNPIASLVNSDGTITKPTIMGNVKSNIGLDSPTDSSITADKAQKGVSDLLNSTQNLNNVATTGDLQALAQAGLDFTGNNSDTTVHRPLSSKLTVEGEGGWDGKNSAADNLYVQADAENNKLVVKMNKDLTGLNSVETKDADGNVAKMTAAGTAVKDKDGNTANYGANGSTIEDKNGNKTIVDAKGSTVTDTEGNTANYGANGSTIEDKDGNKTTVVADGTIVAGKDGSSATYGKDGVSLKGADGSITTIGRDDKGNLTVSTGVDTKPKTLATTDDLASAIKGSDGKDGKDGKDADSAGSKGLTSKDGLNGTDLNTKVNALRNGEAGPIVYTDSNGTRLVKANDGQYYPAAQVNENGEPKDGATAETNPIASLVNSDGTITKPTIMGNVKSNIGLDSPTDSPVTADKAQKGVSDLLNSTQNLNNVATTGDLQALAQAGLDFTGNNSDTTVHRPLSSKLTVEGEGGWDGKKSAADNLYVQADAENNKLVVKMNKDLTGLNSVETKDADGNVAKMTAAGTAVEDKDGNTANYGAKGSAIADKDGNQTTVSANGSAVTDKDGNAANYGAKGSAVTDKDGNAANYGAKGSTVADKDGNTANSSAKGSTVTDKNGNQTIVSADGTTVTGKDGVSATYSKDGVALKGADGKTTTLGRDADGNLTVTNGIGTQPKTLATTNDLHNLSNQFDNKLDNLDRKVNRNNRKLRSGIAAVTAMTNIPQVTLPGKAAVGAGVGTYEGEGAVSVGYSRMSDNGKVILKLSAGASTRGTFNAGAGVAYQW